ncbi:glycoprotein B [Phascolarctid gammaherpesvirus 1]|uniref:Glycoprotein B n=1 Tax=Phascolarctid gammaherpesvirus 1 TaxID=2249313 RepID=A0A3Q8J8E9_9GAMA|nr:glycoprotein B [Phascolarctid gammaherpesvirus 1]AZB49186.1 glycoprotein B [Phascolarctid gammaherpesvirus 1]
MAILVLICYLIIQCCQSATVAPTTSTSEDRNTTVHIDQSALGNFPFRVCSASAVGDIFRFPVDQECPDAPHDSEHNEGILLIYKTNIVAHTFKVRKYRKIVTSTTVYNGVYDDSITSQDTSMFSIRDYERQLIDKEYKCHNAIQVVRDGVSYLYVDRDDTNTTVELKPLPGLTPSVSRYNSQPDIYADARWGWGSYARRTTVNCEITDMVARSHPPFDFFVTSTGDTLEISPFYNASANDNNDNHEDGDQIEITPNYTFVEYEQKGQAGNSGNHTRIFVSRSDFTLSWALKTKNESYCALTLWKSFSSGIQTKYANTYHFVANDITASLVTNHTQLQNFTTDYSCVSSALNTTIEAEFAKINHTHKMNGSMEFYLTGGGLFLVWQPVIPIELHELAGNLTNSTGSSSRRRRRDVSQSNEGSVATSQVQYAYDSLRASINKVLRQISKSWCLDQRRAAQMWQELSKINPTSVMSALYGRAVSAKRVGDVISVSQCVNVDPSSVALHSSMRIFGDTTTCYARPPVTFKFKNDSDTYSGQLGVMNEILLTTSYTEKCRELAEHYIQAGKDLHYYKNYEHVKSVPIASIATLDIFIALNLTLIENIDFEVIELYSQEEKKASNVFDLETMFREHNYYAQKLAAMRRDLDNSLYIDRTDFFSALSGALGELGTIGTAILNVASGITTIFASVVSGVFSFLKNPFGGMLIIVLLVGVVVVVLLLMRQNRAFIQTPMKMIFPGLDKLTSSHRTDPPEFTDEYLQTLIIALHDYQQRHPVENVPKGKTSYLPTFLQGLLPSRRGYKRLPEHDKDFDV